MASRVRVGAWKVAGQGAAGVLLATLLVLGCGEGSKKEAAENKPAGSEEKSVRAQDPAPAKAAALQAAPIKPKRDAFLHQSFAEATVPEPPEGQYLPDKTMTNKSVGKLYSEVKALWDKILFTSSKGKRIQYRAT